MRILLALPLTLIGLPAAAYDICHEAWFLRNLNFDRAGYCFGSALGQAVFDNTGCVGTAVTLGAEAQRHVAAVKEFEDWFGCNVNTAQTRLDLPYANMLRRLESLPVPTDTGSGCMGYHGAEFDVYAGPRMTAPVLARVKQGYNITWEYTHVSVEGWGIVAISDDRGLIAIGWSSTPVRDPDCDLVAG
ncbi:DUF4453 domain-containing protein [Maritimibacter sp. DP1N21-5]|uniref:DUF4453 domain-containing protein n=1 Tax=Maritimibacter sp. DP1N21-5 TaxID=2836867 RepID=UPI001C44310E|nr:DUF4453 domain-containing protein [Maritimibacter sp. DP1N21-5]MBV7408280.1 DUF4453 domain-containing protein [Maritimibacter sp. DP1N21-5]